MNHKPLLLTFVVPDSGAFHSGGNLYNAALIGALREQGVHCTVSEPESLSKPSSSKQRLLLWDTLFLDRLAYLNPADTNWLIVHHLNSLYPPKGYSSAQYFEQKERRLLEQFDGFLVSSPFTANYLKKKGLGVKEICVIRPALTFDPGSFERNFGTVNALMVANLQERKGIEPFLKALVTDGPVQGFSLVMVGSADFEPAYAQRCLALIDNEPYLKKRVMYAGSKTPGEMPQIYQQANLFISTASMETYGMALQEAAATGLPLLVVKGGNAGNHVEEGHNGFILETIPELVRELREISSNLNVLRSIGENANLLTKSNNYTWKNAAQILIDYLG